MKKTGVFLAVLLCLTSLAFAMEEEEASFSKRSMMLDGTVEPGKTVAVMAPFGGVLLDSSLKAGDIVQAGDVLHTIDTVKVYAPFDGVIGSVGLKAGDEVAKVQERYSALMYIEPSSPFAVSTTTAKASDLPENYIIHVGETVYLRSTATIGRAGTGFITQVDNKNYTVEVTEGNLKLDEYVNIYRSKDYVRNTCIGSGKINRSTNVAITAEDGAVYKVHAEQGDAVKRGDLLLELVTGAISIREIPESQVRAEVNGVVASVDVAAGETVSKNQLLSTLYPFDQFQISALISEYDLPYVDIGDVVRIELTSLWEQSSLSGAVAGISGLNTPESSEDADDSAANYTVYIDFPFYDILRQGMNVKVYFNEE